ncbi:MAG: molybdenum cofactor guanylyltransferase [Planctomycetota bacterium]
MTATIGVILTGGASRRMGTPKQYLQLSTGQTMMARMFDILGACSDHIITAGGAAPDATRNIHLDDVLVDAGPIAGIHAACMNATAGALLIVPCDMPRLTPDVLRTLASNPAQTGACFRIDQTRPLPMRIEAAARDAAAHHAADGGRSLRSLVDALEMTVMQLSTADTTMLANVNTPDDLAAL